MRPEDIQSGSEEELVKILMHDYGITEEEAKAITVEHCKRVDATIRLLNLELGIRVSMMVKARKAGSN